jgi:putrescine aminotransferase
VGPTPFLHPYARPTAESSEFLTIVRGEGALVWDSEGRRYVDGMASLWYCAVGHGRRELDEAAAAQMSRIAAYNAFDIFTNEPAEELSALVAERSPMPGSRVFLTSSGSEAVDTAIKLGRMVGSLDGHPERHVVVSRLHAYHGVTYGGLSSSGLPPNQEHFGPYLANERIAAHDIAEAEALFARRGDEIAVVLCEPVQGAGGVRPPVPGYLARLRELCDEHGALLVLDEVITGFGRLGGWFSAERYGVVPDMITFAKGCTSGYLPLGGVIVGERVRDALEADPSFVLRHGFTYSGHPTCCAVGVANIGLLESDRLFDRVPRIERRFADGLGSLLDDGLVVEVRGDAAVWAAGLAEHVDASLVRDEMLARGVICRPIGPATVAFCPPLVIDGGEIDQCLTALEESLRAAGA